MRRGVLFGPTPDDWVVDLVLRRADGTVFRRRIGISSGCETEDRAVAIAYGNVVPLRQQWAGTAPALVEAKARRRWQVEAPKVLHG